MNELLSEYREQTQDFSALELLAWGLKTFGAKGITLASSLGAEDQLLTHYLIGLEPEAKVFVLDTGRHFQETYDCIAATEARYGFRYQVFAPRSEALQALVAEQGVNGFYQSIAARKACCGVRKVEPLGRALEGVKAWVTGQRIEQSPTRSGLDPVEWDAGHQMFKLNPLARWSEAEVFAATKQLEVPLHELHQKGYPSIGCQPCTRAVKPGEDPRSGRWWWEAAEHKECGLHIRPLEGE